MPGVREVQLDHRTGDLRWRVVGQARWVPVPRPAREAWLRLMATWGSEAAQVRLCAEVQNARPH